MRLGRPCQKSPGQWVSILENVRFYHYFKPISSLFKFLWNFIALNVAIDYFIKIKSKNLKKNLLIFDEKMSQNQMPEIIQLTRVLAGCEVSSRLMAWVVLLILSSGTLLKRVRSAFTNLWSKVPWKPAVSILRLYKSSRRLPSRFRYSSFKPSDTESSWSCSGTVSFWERVSTVRSSIQKRGLTFRSAVTGSGVVVDDTGEGVTLFGVQPVLCTAVNLK